MGHLTIPEPLHRNLHLAKQVDQESINAISKAIIEINENDKLITKVYSAYGLTYNPKPIMLYIDSYGGQVYQCLGLLGIMKKSEIPVHTVVTGCAMSCGFLISISGHKRFGYEGSTFLYHQVSSGANGKVKDMEEKLVESKRLQKVIEKHTLKNTKITKDQLKKSYTGKFDWYITAEKAIKLGVIDTIV